ncbi:MAG: colicin E3/pyocin S6 family cytotoxin [Chloroflexaceae bacterium]|nr:colicin E3/pyocin S6 family cytotoxin [Chloroflexaceae bacterium]
MGTPIPDPDNPGYNDGRPGGLAPDGPRMEAGDKKEETPEEPVPEGSEPQPEESEDTRTIEEKQAGARQAIHDASELLKQNPELKGEYTYQIEAKQRQLEELLEDLPAIDDPDIRKLYEDEIADIEKDVRDIERQIQGSIIPPPLPGEQPDYIRDERAPLPHETILADQNRFTRTGILARHYEQVYRDKEGNYYHIDRTAKGESAEIEVYDSQGRHIGVIDPQTGQTIYGPESGRRLNL